MRRLLEEGEVVVEPEDLRRQSLNVAYTPQASEDLVDHFGHSHFRVVGFVVQEYDVRTTLAVRRRGHEPGSVGKV